MKPEDFIGKKVIYDQGSQMIFGVDENDKQQLILDVRGWGAIQNRFKNLEEAGKFQDELGQWICDAINARLNTAIIESPDMCCEIVHEHKKDFDKVIHDENSETKALPIIVHCMLKYGRWCQK